MQHFRTLEDVHLRDTWLTIGTFDGVHRGHQEILDNVVTGARQAGAQSVALTFFPPPAVVLRKRSEPYYLTSPEERATLMGELGIDLVVTYPFTLETSTISARSFTEMLHRHLGMRHLCVGADFALGRGREGNVPYLRRLGEELEFTVEAYPAVMLDGQVISSSLVRAFLAAGEVDQVTRLLGRPFQVNGEVVRGDGRGKLLGIPTANLSIWAERAIPKAGVYACRAHVNGQSWQAVANVGVRPTFEREPVPPRVEAHILDFDDEIYNQQIHLDFVSHIRDEVRFPSVNALLDQIEKDITQARETLSVR
jgi:riboflavin kinase/FMN adenylyltransferase